MEKRRKKEKKKRFRLYPYTSKRCWLTSGVAEACSSRVCILNIFVVGSDPHSWTHTYHHSISHLNHCTTRYRYEIVKKATAPRKIIQHEPQCNRTRRARALAESCFQCVKFTSIYTTVVLLPVLKIFEDVTLHLHFAFVRRLSSWSFYLLLSTINDITLSFFPCSWHLAEVPSKIFLPVWAGLQAAQTRFLLILIKYFVVTSHAQVRIGTTQHRDVL